MTHELAFHWQKLETKLRLDPLFLRFDGRQLWTRRIQIGLRILQRIFIQAKNVSFRVNQS